MSTNITASLYCPGQFFTSTNNLEDLKNSGFTTIIAWAFHVAPNGDISNGGELIQNGAYVGASDWQNIGLLKQGNTTVSRILFSIGGWGADDFDNIENLMLKTPVNKGGGTAPGSILYNNFKLLIQNLPYIDGIDFDDESLLQSCTYVVFSQMLYSLGLQVTFCPFNNMEVRIDSLSKLNSNNNNIVTGFNLQCYAGGSGNNPQDWINAIQAAMGEEFPAAAFVTPGLQVGSGYMTYEDVQNQMASWEPTGIQSGFIWDYNGIQSGTAPTDDYSAAITSGLE
jgi:hypothetical protein